MGPRTLERHSSRFSRLQDFCNLAATSYINHRGKKRSANISTRSLAVLLYGLARAGQENESMREFLQRFDCSRLLVSDMDAFGNFQADRSIQAIIVYKMLQLIYLTTKDHLVLTRPHSVRQPDTLILCNAISLLLHRKWILGRIRVSGGML